MNTQQTGTNVGRKNIIFGVALFLILGVVAGIPLSIDLFGGSTLTAAQYQAWKVIHAYGVFLAFVNFFFGYGIDRLALTDRQKEIASWSFLIAALAGGLGRATLLLLALQGGAAGHAMSLIETVGFVIGTIVFVNGQLGERAHRPEQRTAALTHGR